MLTTVKGTYDHGQIIWDEVPPVQKRTEVIVIFLENEPKAESQKAGLQDKKGARFGSPAGKVSVPSDFNEPLDDLNKHM